MQKRFVSPGAPLQIGSLDLRRGVRLPSFREANVEHIRAQPPLPETADEVCAAAKIEKAGNEDIRLGSAATETEIKALNAKGVLADYKFLHLPRLGDPGHAAGNATVVA
jgi:hypothetical protein